MSVSGEEYKEEQEAVVCVRRSDWARLTEREELVGKFNFGSRFPQYLEAVSDHIVRCEVQMVLSGLNDSDIDWRGRASTVDLLF